jgi:hypothetical protein
MVRIQPFLGNGDLEVGRTINCRGYIFPAPISLGFVCGVTYRKRKYSKLRMMQTNLRVPEPISTAEGPTVLWILLFFRTAQSE